MSERPDPGTEQPVPTQPERDLWQGSAVEVKLERQRQLGINPPRALITDRDGTHSVFGYAFKGSPQELEAYNQETANLNQHLAERGTILIMNTGGSIEMMQQGLADGSIPADAAIVAGGGEFYVVKDGRYVKDETYQKHIEDELGYKRSELYPICRQLVADLNSGAAATVEDFRLEFQPRDSEANVTDWERYAENPTQTNKPTKIEIPQPNKISFYCYGGEAGLELARTQLQQRLARLELGHLKIVHSIDTYDPSRFQMDLLPVTKREAADNVITLMKQQFGPILFAVAGDAENDIEVILHSGDAGIVVGNSQPSLEEAVEDQPASRETRHFKIIDGRLIYIGDPSKRVGASLLRAVKALERADNLIKNR